ncbi:hypothetical protein MIMGU_mgv1a005771mg [Erythranthe guttata]|uniref:CRM domain-containing protein n=1 Tax=Erythranthe guttata TaxID=4155 RepID=A0A022RXK7_ERYGU|nr:hypothetical protein MIMGU_mgv1a005771mg [Erythranthe guttata]
MSSRVEKRMHKESGKTLSESRRATKLRKKLMTDEERLIYDLRRAKKKVALLLQKLKKYELPELPPSRHDPELFTLEQLQAYKKIGFRNKNYVPVGVRGVFGGVVQNMHLHWKFHETVQVCCDNFPKEKIKEMATMLARLSGGIVVNIHNIKTIIMFRGRNYRQPKNLIPINTLTKRKALFKARFEQALESQKLNIKQREQELRRRGVNPEDPVAMASIQRVASTFFNAIDKREGSPYIFREDKTTTRSRVEPEGLKLPQDSGDESDQEDLDKFIADLEVAADKEWEEEEAAEKEELHRIRYWNREDFGDDENGGRVKNWNQNQNHRRTNGNRRGEDRDFSEVDEDLESDGDVSEEGHDKFDAIKVDRKQHSRANSRGFKLDETEYRGREKRGSGASRNALSDLDDVAFESDGEGENPREYRSSSDEGEEDYEQLQRYEGSNNSKRSSNKSTAKWESDATSGDDVSNGESDK